MYMYPTIEQRICNRSYGWMDMQYTCEHGKPAVRSRQAIFPTLEICFMNDCVKRIFLVEICRQGTLREKHRLWCFATKTYLPG